ncbi:uncharacterized protein LOC135478260 [Liolophura sinensis]|uniref:uncharacterized protein LOC135478260 n=1 Tax=Liolophura sinensis TaxID=3198878 RepID=UPI0031591AF6
MRVSCVIQWCDQVVTLSGEDSCNGCIYTELVQSLASTTAKMSFDTALAKQCLEWIQEVTGDTSFDTSGERSNFQSVLQNGVVLCKLMNSLKPGSIPEKKYSKPPKMAFQQMELIGEFLGKVPEYGIPDQEKFQTVDLYEGKNLKAVLICFQSMARKPLQRAKESLDFFEAGPNYMACDQMSIAFDCLIFLPLYDQAGLSYQFTVTIRREGNKRVGVHVLIAGGIRDRYTQIHFVSGHLLQCCYSQRHLRMSYRAEKSGYSAEAYARLEAKYDPAVARQCLLWMETLFKEAGEEVQFDTSGDAETFQSDLKDGIILCRLMNTICPGSIAANKLSKPPTMPFKQMELIQYFVAAVRNYGVADHENFATVDLHESQNLNQVVTCLQALGRKAQMEGKTGFGPKEARLNKRDFSAEQLKAGQNVINLQYGTNKGANQSGMAFGKHRSIIGD